MKWVPVRRGYQPIRTEITTVSTLACATVTLFTFVHHQGPYPVTMFFPPVGAVYAYLILRGPEGVPAAAVGVLLGNAVTMPRQLAAAPAVEIAHAVLLAGILGICAYPPHRAWRHRPAGTPVFGLLTLFVLSGLLAAPVLVAAASYGLSELLGPPLRMVDLAQMVLGLTTGIASITPACLVGAVLLLGRPPSALRTRVDGRRAALVPAAVIVLAPVLALAVPGAQLRELWLLPLAAVPLVWISATGDLARSALVLAGCALLVGVLTGGLFDDGTELYRAQVMVLCCALASLYVAAACITEASTRLHQEAATTRWRALLAAAPAMVARVSADGTWRAEPDVTGLTRDQGPGRQAAARQMLQAHELRELTEAIEDRHPRSVRWRSDGEDPRNFVTQVTPLPDGETLLVTTETTLADAAEAALAWERTHDRETGLPSRDLLLATAERAVAAGTPGILLVVDLDHLIRHAGLTGVDGPAVLRTLAQRLHDVFGTPSGDGCMVARTADEQLAALVPGVEQLDPDDVAPLLAAVSTPVEIDAGRVPVRASVGLATLESPEGAREALRRAAVAAEASNERGDTQIVIADRLSLRTASEQARLVADVMAAVDNDELRVVYQPDVHPADGRLTGMEALVRWRRPGGRSVSTQDFVRVAEEAGAVPAIDDWVMRESLGQLARWQDDLDVVEVELGINVSALSLTADLPARLDAECRRLGLAPGRIRLEVTETALGDDSRAIPVLHRARELGFRVALDDFGTGYASLSRLRTLPVDVIKLDRSFLASLVDDPATQALVGMILGLAEPLHMDVVVEGVETAAQRDILVQLGCQRAQGFLFARPAGAAAISELLRPPA
jgi:EAL domain-containing protein (putative c-di-GMP-specific phosphodiesterase class I)/GGDEF domain-containing protein